MIWLEALSYVVTILGFPTAIWVIWREERLRRRNEEHELHRNLSEEYDNFLRMVMDNADLLLMSHTAPPSPLTDEQSERTDIIFRMLVSLFEKAYIILFSDTMDSEARRVWNSWRDDMHEWCQRPDFRAALPAMLEGEDDAFSLYFIDLANEIEAKSGVEAS
ncbi:hypothetical protein OO012_00745 [Rhodobacteraceae bacterium KMM 6894]|nr:hypothetical protein [Rhodobacteraceae bacterium KMM 6894]